MGQLPRKVAFPMSPPADNAFWENQNNILAHRINYGSTFGNNAPDNNMESWMVDVASSGVAANTEFHVLHNLLRIPIHFHVYSKDGSVIYSQYPGMTPWTAATSAGDDGRVYLKSTGANTGFRIIIF